MMLFDSVIIEHIRQNSGLVLQIKINQVNVRNVFHSALEWRAQSKMDYAE